MDGFYYLASPYSHPDPAVRQRRYDDLMLDVVALTDEGVCIFSPILHWHETAVRYRLPTDHLFWRASNHAMIAASVGVILLELEGWEDSRGIADELEYIAAIGKPLIRRPHELVLCS